MIYFPLEWAIVYYLLLSAIGVALMLWDRHLSKGGRHRYISELLLLFVGFLGAAPAMMVTMFATRHKLHKKKFYLSLPLMTLLHAALFTVVAIFGPTFPYTQAQVDALYLLGYFLAVSFVATILTFTDKENALRNQRRISEDTLMFWAGLGGALGMLITMLCIAHKTNHRKFMVGLPIMIAIHGVIFYWLWVVTDLVYFYH